MATNKVDMSLDDIIKQNRKPGRGGVRGRGRGRGVARGGRGGTVGMRGRSLSAARGGRFGVRKEFGGVARGGVGGRRNNRRPIRGSRFMRGSQFPVTWRQEVFKGGFRRGARGVAAAAVGNVVRNQVKEGTLMISNLDFGVNDADMNELFSEFGSLKSATVHYDKSGRSLGTAQIVFQDSEAALKALRQYNSVPLDGKPMKISLVGGDQAKNTLSSRLGSSPRGGSAPRGAAGRGALARGAFRQRGGFGARGGFQARGGQRGGFRGNRGRGGVRGNRGGARGGKKPVLSREKLDAQLDAYNAKMDLE